MTIHIHLGESCNFICFRLYYWFFLISSSKLHISRVNFTFTLSIVLAFLYHIQERYLHGIVVGCMLLIPMFVSLLNLIANIWTFNEGLLPERVLQWARVNLRGLQSFSGCLPSSHASYQLGKMLSVIYLLYNGCGTSR